MNPKVEGAVVDPGLGDGPASDVEGVTRQIVDGLLADRTLAFRRPTGGSRRVRGR